LMDDPTRFERSLERVIPKVSVATRRRLCELMKATLKEYARELHSSVDKENWKLAERLADEAEALARMVRIVCP